MTLAKAWLMHLIYPGGRTVCVVLCSAGMDY